MEKRLCIVIAPTNHCNLHCDYCYNQFNCFPGEIDIKLISDIIQKAFREYDYVDFVWRGGEPLLLSNRFYRSVFYLQLKESRKLGVAFHNGIQTNGTLLTKRKIRFFKRFRFEIGISFDGLDNEMHRSDSERTLRALSNCKKMKFPVGIIAVVTKDSNSLIKQYDYLKQWADSVKFTPCFETPNVDLSVNAEWFIQELKDLFEYWIVDEQKVFVAPISDYVRFVLGVYKRRTCVHASCLGKMLDIDSKGEIRICSHVSDNSFSLGSFFEYDRIEDIFSSEKFNAVVSSMIDKRNKCKDDHCELFGFCQGGCCAECYLQKDQTNTFSCTVLKSILPYIAFRVKDILSKKDNLSEYNPAFVEMIQEAFCYNPTHLLSLSEK